ncbi:MAG: hypothetical protein WAU81_08035 [Candidatus Aminicenantales bacterium]
MQNGLRYHDAAFGAADFPAHSIRSGDWERSKTIANLVQSVTQKLLLFMKPLFSKRIFTARSFLNDIGYLQVKMPSIVAAMRNPAISSAFREK